MVQWAKFYYVNQYGQQSHTELKYSTVRMCLVSRTDLAHHHPQYPGETEYERAKRLDLLDVWTPVAVFKVCANESVVYTGAKAIEMKGLWWNKLKKDNK